MAGTGPDVRLLLPQQKWELLFQQTLLFADYQVRRLPWRGAMDGLLPDGYDAKSLANQAILEFLQQCPDSSQVHPNNHPSSPSPFLKERASPPSEVVSTKEGVSAKLSPTDLPPPLSGFSLSSGERAGVRAKLRTPDPPPPHVLQDSPDLDDLEPILWELKRLVLRNVSRLHHHKENWVLCNVEDLASVQIDDGDLVNPIELIPDPGPHPDTALLEKESLAQFDSLKSRFSSFIKREPRLGRLFELLCDGVEKPQALASSLKLRRGTVRNLRKRLRRRWRRFFGDSTTRK